MSNCGRFAWDLLSHLPADKQCNKSFVIFGAIQIAGPLKSSRAESAIDVGRLDVDTSVRDTQAF